MYMYVQVDSVVLIPFFLGIDSEDLVGEDWTVRLDVRNSVGFI